MADHDEELQRLATSIYREKVARARATPTKDKLFSGIELFDRVVPRMRAGVKMQHPEADDAEVERVLRKRMAILRRLDETAWTTTTR